MGFENWFPIVAAICFGLMAISLIIAMGFSIQDIPKHCERLGDNLNLETRYDWMEGCLVNYNSRWIREDKIYSLLNYNEFWNLYCWFYTNFVST